MPTFEEMKAACDAHNAAQDKHFLSKIVDEVSAEKFARSVLQDVAELPDRTSPEDQPEMLLVTEHELFDIIVEKLSY